MNISDSLHRPTELIDIENPVSWPTDLRDYLEENLALFIDWETGPTTTKAWQFDRFIYGLRDLLVPYSLVGWHCSRLTEDEVVHIENTGMQPPDLAMLSRRIDALVDSGRLTAEIGGSLKASNQADDEHRAGLIYFCFFPPREDAYGVQDFFRYWGGEALYNFHDDDPITGPVIQNIGTPCVIEAVVPISHFRQQTSLATKVALRYAISRGHQSTEPVDHVDSIASPVPAANIRRVVPFSAAEFSELAAFDGWNAPYD